MLWYNFSLHFNFINYKFLMLNQVNKFDIGYPFNIYIHQISNQIFLINFYIYIQKIVDGYMNIQLGRIDQFTILMQNQVLFLYFYAYVLLLLSFHHGNSVSQDCIDVRILAILHFFGATTPICFTIPFHLHSLSSFIFLSQPFITFVIYYVLIICSPPMICWMKPST